MQVSAPLPKQPGDVSSSVQLATPPGVTSSVPLTARALIPSAKSTPFKGVITGGEGRMSLAQSNIYYLDVPAGRQDLGIGVTLDTDPNVGIQGVLTAPDGQVSSFQTNLTTGADNSGFQIYRRDPAPGRWVFSLQTPDPATGIQPSDVRGVGDPAGEPGCLLQLG